MKTKNRFSEGEIVFAKINPTLKLIVRRYVDRVYYCQIADDLKHDDLVYYERELIV